MPYEEPLSPFILQGDPRAYHPDLEPPKTHHGADIAAKYAARPDLPKMTRADEAREVGPMNTQDERLALLSTLRQNADPSSDSGPFRCGATSLLGAAIYGDGEKGIWNLIEASEKYEKEYEDRLRKAGVDVKDDHVNLAKVEEKLKRGAELEPEEKRAIDRKKMAEIKEKIAYGKPLTQADLEATQQGVYDFVGHKTINNAGDEEKDHGMKDGDIAALIRSSPELGKMFREKDMHIDSINSPGRFSHIVLGIGSDASSSDGAHKMYFDPYARGHKGADGALELDSQLTYGKKAREDYAGVTVNEVDATGTGVHEKPGGKVEGDQERKAKRRAEEIEQLNKFPL